MIEIRAGRYFLGVWFIRGEDLNWLGAVYHDGDGSWRLQDRVQGEAGASAKEWVCHELDGPLSEASILQHMIRVSKEIGSMMGSGAVCEFVPLRSADPDVIVAALKAQSWIEKLNLDRTKLG